MEYYNENIKSWNESVAIGNEGERIVGKFLHDRGNKVEYIGKPVNGKLSYKDIKITNRDGHIINFEVKTDTSAETTGNLVFEQITNERLNSLGWWKLCTADIIAWYIKGINTIVTINKKDIEEHYNECYVRTTQTHDKYSYDKTGVIDLLSIKKLYETCPSFQHFEL